MFVFAIALALLCVSRSLGAQWTNLAPMNISRSDHTASLLNNIVVVAGGCVSYQTCQKNSLDCFCTEITATVEGYSPATNTWTRLPPMPQARTRHSAAVVGNKLYVFGGRTLSDNIISEVYYLEQTSSGWAWRTTAPSWPQPASDAVAFTDGSNIFLAGGYTQTYDSLTTMTIFHPDTGVYEAGASMTHDRGDACASVADGKAYVVGGFSAESFCVPLNVLEVYDFQTKTWSSGTAMDQARGDPACATNHKEFHVMGGEQKDRPVNCSFISNVVDQVESYQITQNHWLEEDPVPAALFRFAAVGYDGFIYLFGGQTPFTVSPSGDATNQLLGTVYRYKSSNAPDSSSDNSSAHNTPLCITILVAFAIATVLL